jgi:hypothetical protein
MGDIVNFNKKLNKIEFDEFLSNDSYLRTTALNGLKQCGYRITRNGVLQFQRDNNLKQTGVLCIDDLSILLVGFDSQTRQEVINYLEKKNMKRKNNNSIIITLLALLFFELYGVVSCFFDIVHLIKK